MRAFLPALLLLAGCVEGRGAEDPSEWYADGESLDVTEPVGYTDQPYDFPADDADGIAVVTAIALDAPDTDTIVYAPDDGFPPGDCPSEDDARLPFEVEGIVTLHPRYYIKTSGCDRDSDEKYYGSYFIEDRTGGIFVLGDSKVAHFDMGDRVRLKVRGARAAYSGLTDTPLPTVYAHDVLETEFLGQDISYRELTRDPVADDIGKTFRVSGTVEGEMSTFGELPFRPDYLAEGQDMDVAFHIKLDQELTRRGYEFHEGDRLQVTGPMLLSYSEYSLVVMKIGQIEVLDSED